MGLIMKLKSIKQVGIGFFTIIIIILIIMIWNIFSH